MIESVIETDREPMAIEADGSLHHTDLDLAVYGLGPTGVALSVLCAQHVGSVTAADTDGTRVTAVQHGQSPTDDPLLSEYLSEVTANGSLRATGELPTAAAEATIHLVSVPTGLREDDVPDLSVLRSTVRDIATEISAGDILVVTTPVPPGTTEGVVASTIADESSLEPDQIGLAVCALPNDRSLRSIRTGDLVVAGTDRRSQTATRELFSAITTGTVSTTPLVTTAECIEVIERSATEMLRCLTNEIALSTPEVSVPTVAELISMRGEITVPGPGVDGTEPIGAGFLRDALVDQTPVLDSVYDAAQQFPRLIAETVLAAIDDSGDESAGGSESADPANNDTSETTILIMGVPAAGNSTADSMPVSMLIRELTRAETRPLVCDPVVDLPRSLTPHAVSIRTATQLDPDAVVLLSFRLVFEDIDWSAFEETVIIDCCGSDIPDIDADIRRLGGTDRLSKQ